MCAYALREVGTCAVSSASTAVQVPAPASGRSSPHRGMLYAGCCGVERRYRPGRVRMWERPLRRKRLCCGPTLQSVRRVWAPFDFFAAVSRWLVCSFLSPLFYSFIFLRSSVVPEPSSEYKSTGGLFAAEGVEMLRRFYERSNCRGARACPWRVARCGAA